MTQEERSTTIQSLNEVFNFIEDLADKENNRLNLFIKAMGYYENENEPIIIETEAKIKELRDKAEKIQRVIDLLINEGE